MQTMRVRIRVKLVTAAVVWALALAFSMSVNSGQEICPQGVVCTPQVPPELPVEIESEMAPGSLKQAPLWHELAQLLDNPYAFTCPDAAAPSECVAAIKRRPSFLPAGCSYQPDAAAFGIPACNDRLMPRLNVWNPNFNVLTGQPMRLRTTDGEISWDQPGLLFGPDDDDPATPVTDVIGRLFADASGNLAVERLSDAADLPTTGAVVATPAFTNSGEILDDDGGTVAAFEKPISEIDLLRRVPPTNDEDNDVTDVGSTLRRYIGRPGAQALGKALFWDMQVGSDGVQACGTCHFHAGTDNRTRNQLNPNHLGGDHTFQVKQPNEDVSAGDFPFRKLGNPEIASEGDPAQTVLRDSNDVMSSMGVRFRKFADIPAIGAASFGPPANPAYPGVKALLPDVPVTDAEMDPIAGFQGLRRVEPRNTPTIFATAFNFDNFWDGRARHDANGGSPFGPTDPQFHVFVDPGPAGSNLHGATNGHFRPELRAEDPEIAEQPVRIRFSSLASLATGPALSDFEMSFAGRNWPKLAKKLLQANVTPLANQLVDPTDSVLGPFSGQRAVPGGPVNRPGRTGLNVSYPQLIRLAFKRKLWQNTDQHLRGCYTDDSGRLPACGAGVPPDPFDGFVLRGPVAGAAGPNNRNQFTQMEANFSLFFGMALQVWQELLIPDNTPFDRFMDANPNAANGIGQPGEQGTLPPSVIPALVGTLTFPNANQFGPDELFGFDIFTGANLTAALPVGSPRNPTGVGSNPFLRTARCALCHFGPEQSDHTNNVNAGLLLSGTEFEFPTPPDAPEPTGPFRVVTGIALAEEVEENAQDGVELELRNFQTLDDPTTPNIDERVIAFPGAFSFQDNGVYNIGVRPTGEDIMRGGNDPFGWPLSLAALALKNLAGSNFEPCDTPNDPGTLTKNEPPTFGSPCTGVMANFDPGLGRGGGLFEETGADQRINPGLAMEPVNPMLPEYLAPWVNNLPAGELHPQIDELAVAPNTITEPVAGPTIEFAEILFGSDQNCGIYDPALYGAGAPNFGWGPFCPNSQSAITNNFDAPLNGTWPFANRVARNGAVKVPQLRNVELTGPYFHTGSYLTLRQVVDFYMRGGDFPVTNAADRDPNLVDVGRQAFGFGATNNTANLPPALMDGFPDVITRYGPMPDLTHASTPEPPSSTPEQAKVALVKFLLSLTDRRVKFEQAPFDHPEVIVPLDGTAPDNTAGRAALVGDSRFRVVPAVGAAGRATPLAGFLGVTSNPTANCSTNVSHFCR